jgi:hypothetical protein
MKLPKKDPKPLQLPTDPKTLIWVGAILLLLGAVVPLLMVVKIIPSTFLINFVSYAFQLVGMVSATTGIFSVVKVRRDDLKKKDNIFHEPRHPDDK